MAVLDWYIRLRDKDRYVLDMFLHFTILTINRMVGCDLSYGAEAGGNTTSVENFLPLYRTIKIQPLVKNTSYWVHMVCKDRWGVECLRYCPLYYRNVRAECMQR